MGASNTYWVNSRWKPPHTSMAPVHEATSSAPREALGAFRLLLFSPNLSHYLSIFTNKIQLHHNLAKSPTLGLDMSHFGSISVLDEDLPKNHNFHRPSATNMRYNVKQKNLGNMIFTRFF